MSRRWEGLAARARGLTSHLLTDDRMHRLERTKEVSEMIHELRDTPYARFLAAPTAGPEELDTAIARSATERLHTLGRWADSDGDVLLPVFLEQDLRNVRLVLRGLVGGTPKEQRLSGAMPTPTLDRKALELLAEAESAASLASTLVAWGHPFGSDLLKAAVGAHPDAFRMEAALARALTAAVSGYAERAGGVMAGFVRDSIDTNNILTAALLVRSRHEGEAGAFFADGGRRLSRPDFIRAASSADRRRCVDVLEKATRGSLFVGPLKGLPASPAGLARRILVARIDDLARRRRRDPLSPAPAILFVLRLRVETVHLRRAVWRVSLMGGGR